MMIERETIGGRQWHSKTRIPSFRLSVDTVPCVGDIDIQITASEWFHLS
jgi:hypothetical protein